MPKPIGILGIQPVATVAVKFDPPKPGAKAAAAAASKATAKKMLASSKKR